MYGRENLRQIDKMHQKVVIKDTFFFGKVVQDKLINDIDDFFDIKKFPLVLFGGVLKTGYYSWKNIIYYDPRQVRNLRHTFSVWNNLTHYDPIFNFYAFVMAHEFAHVQQWEEGSFLLDETTNTLYYKGIAQRAEQPKSQEEHFYQKCERDANRKAAQFCEKYKYVVAGLLA